MEKPKFTSAKIKKLMQADNDVGRVAAPALTLAGKSVELFASELITKAAAVMAKDDKSSKTLTIQHIKQCVEGDSLFDFLKTTVQETHAAPAKRARAPGGASRAPKRAATEGAQPTADRGGAAGSSSGAASAEQPGAAASLALAADYRPLADADDDYDADD